jgi:DNA-binding NarL/FixJ family response regulator
VGSVISHGTGHQKLPRRRACEYLCMRFVVADDSLLVRHGLVALLAAMGHEVAGVAVRAERVLSLVARSRPDIALLDVRLPPTFTVEGLRLATTIRERHPGVGVLVLSQHVEPAYAELLLHVGVTRVGYLLKDRVLAADNLGAALRRIHEGGTVIDEDLVVSLMDRPVIDQTLPALTDRESDVLALMAQGFSDRGPAGRATRTRPVSRDRTRCPRCPASRGTTPRRHRQAVVARVPRRARSVARIRPQGRPSALHPRARCRPARQGAADS